MTTTLLEAASLGNAAGIRALVAQGADPNLPGDDGTTPLMRAACGGHLAAVTALVAAGADVNAADPAGWTALSKAVHDPATDRGHAEVVQALIDAGADIEAPIGYGIRPLMLAAGYGETAVVQVLLAAGADVLARNHGGLTALMMVKEKFYVDVINLLYEAEQGAGVGEGGCSTKHPPGSQVVTFLRPRANKPS
ncbi:MAG: ankyrin repeat domain-containing protein [Burkholderiales bacterium]|nr:ankyrin repeat domain-containing protein [Burkholderiales bacterium]